MGDKGYRLPAIGQQKNVLHRFVCRHFVTSSRVVVRSHDYS